MVNCAMVTLAEITYLQAFAVLKNGCVSHFARYGTLGSAAEFPLLALSICTSIHLFVVLQVRLVRYCDGHWLTSTVLAVAKEATTDCFYS